jgi:hypothetical protein
MLSWKEYQSYIDRKISDARYNFEYAEKRYLEAKLNYEAALLEKESFEKALDEKFTDK